MSPNGNSLPHRASIALDMCQVTLYQETCHVKRADPAELVVRICSFPCQHAQGLAGAIQAVVQQVRKSSVHVVMLYTLRHAAAFFTRSDKNSPKKSSADTAC